MKVCAAFDVPCSDASERFRSRKFNRHGYFNLGKYKNNMKTKLKAMKDNLGLRVK